MRNKIAMRDLEIRGAGNLLGEQQHGHMEAVGYDLYCKMLNEAVKREKGLSWEEDEFQTLVDMDIDAYIPTTYIRSESQKLDIYKRIAGIETFEESEDMQDELLDRFGDLPKAVQNLLAVACLKIRAHNVYVKEIVEKPDEIRLALYEKAKLNPAAFPEFLARFNGRMKFIKGEKPDRFLKKLWNLFYSRTDEFCWRSVHEKKVKEAGNPYDAGSCGTGRVRQKGGGSPPGP